MKTLFRYFAATVMMISLVMLPSSSVVFALGTYPVVCINLNRNLGYGSQDTYNNTDVSQLQQFLISQNDLFIYAPTGYYGTLTVAAVRRFQQAYGLPITGAADVQTRAAIHSVDCGSPINYGGNGYYNGYGVTINSLSTNSGPVGTYVTMYGNNFDPSNNVVNFGNGSVTNVISSTPTSLTFVVPQSIGAACSPYVACPLYAQVLTPGTYNISVTNSHGTSNAVAFTVTSSYNGYSGYNGNGYSGYVINPTISYVTPSSGSFGTYVTVYGSGFSSTGNTVHVGSTILQNISSSDGNTISFSIPSQNYSCQYSYYSTCTTNYNTYGTQSLNIFVTNSQGYTSNTVYFSVNGTNNGYQGNSGNGGLSINSVNGPVTIAQGVQGNWTVTLYSPYSSFVTTSVHWGDEGPYVTNVDTPQTTYTPNQQTLTFTHTYQTTGTYTILFTARDSSGNQNVTSTTVNVLPYGTTVY